VPHHCGYVHGALQMKEDNDDEDLLISMLFTAFAILVVAFVVVGVGITLWSLL
jgi:hypothetical protein